MLPELKVYDHGLSPLPMQNPDSKLFLGIKSLFVIFSCTYYNKFSSKYCWENILHPSKLNINYLWKFIPMSQNQNISYGSMFESHIKVDHIITSVDYPSSTIFCKSRTKILSFQVIFFL